MLVRRFAAGQCPGVEQDAQQGQGGLRIELRRLVRQFHPHLPGLRGPALGAARSAARPCCGPVIVCSAASFGRYEQGKCGVPVRSGGGTPVSGDSLMTAPPLMTPEATLDRIVSIIGESIQAAT